MGCTRAPQDTSQVSEREDRSVPGNVGPGPLRVALRRQVRGVSAAMGGLSLLRTRVTVVVPLRSALSGETDSMDGCA